MRKLDRDIASVKQVEFKTKNLIQQADKRAQRDPSRRAQANKEVRDFARELVRARRASARLISELTSFMIPTLARIEPSILRTANASLTCI